MLYDAEIQEIQNELISNEIEVSQVSVIEKAGGVKLVHDTWSLWVESVTKTEESWSSDFPETRIPDFKPSRDFKWSRFHEKKSEKVIPNPEFFSAQL